MKVFVLVLLIITTLTDGSPVRMHEHQYREIQVPAVAAASKSKILPQAIRTMAVIFKKLDITLKFLRKYNAIPKLAVLFKLIMPRFQTGRKILRYYEQAKARAQGKTLPDLDSLVSPVGRTSQSAKKETCSCFAKLYSRRRKRYGKKNTNQEAPVDILYQIPWVLLTTTQATTKLTTKTLLDLLPDANQVPYYANLLLDMLDNNFDAWNDKIKGVYDNLKSKFIHNSNNTESNPDYDSYVNDTSSRSSTETDSEYSSDYSESSGSYSSFSNETSSHSGLVDELENADDRSIFKESQNCIPELQDPQSDDDTVKKNA